MRKALITLLLFFGFGLLPVVRAQLSDTSNYETAYTEIAAMIDDKQPSSIKRAVFLVEWAYLDGKLNYDWYCRSIDSTVTFLNRFIAVNSLGRYKTGRNLALYYFTEPLSGNGYKPFTYNFKEVSEAEELTKRMVSSAMRIHEGQCYSLPLYYRILAGALGTECYLSFTRNHSFIRYRNEDNLFPEPWVNVEITTHQIQPEFWIIEHSGINKTMIDQKVYLHPLSVKETIACQLGELASCYAHKYPDSNPDFMLRCIDKALEYLLFRYESAVYERLHYQHAYQGATTRKQRYYR